MAGAAGLFILGICLHRAAPQWTVTWAALGLGAAVVAMAVRRCGEPLLAGAIILAGIAAGQEASFRYPCGHIGEYSSDEPRLAQLEVRIDQPPRVLSDAHAPIPRPPTQAMQGTVLRVLTRAGWRECSGRVLIRIAEVNPQLAVGQRVRITGMLARPVGAENPGQYNWAGYYRNQRILCSLHAPHAGNATILESPAMGPVQWVRLQARRALERGFGPENALDHALLRALVLGDADPQLRDVQEHFLRTGLSHHLAISGMHIVIVGSLAYVLCKGLLLSPRVSATLGLGVVILYAFVVLPSPPVIRSVLLCVAFVVGLLGRRMLDGVQLLSLSVLAMLMWQPLDLYSAGFQLSFGTVLGLMVLATPVLRSLEAMRDIDFVIAERAMGLTRWGKVKRWARVRTLQLLVTGLVAWLVSAPIVEHHFNQLNPWQVLASIALAAPVFASLVMGVAKILLTLIWPGMAATWATMAAWPVGVMRQWVEGLARLPGSDLAVPSLPLWAVAACFAALLLPLWPGVRRSALRFASAGCVCLAVLFLPMARGSRLAEPGKLRLTLLSVGAGQCCIVRTPGGKTVLIDAGSLTIPDVAGMVLTPFLKHAGTGRVDATFISHANIDHFSGIADAARRFGTGTIRVSPQFAGHMHGNPRGSEWLKELGGMEVVSRGVTVALDDRTTAEVLWPDSSLRTDANNASLVLRLTCAGRSILLTGDLLEPAQRQLAALPGGISADILIAPHHGSSEPATKAFLAAVNPSIILASNGRKLSQKQKRFDALAAGRPLYRTHAHGAVSVIIDAAGGVTVETFNARD